MAICKYFQQGYCRFGQNCRNEHVIPSKYSYKAPQAQNNRTGHDHFHSNVNTGNTYGNTNASTFYRNEVQNTSPFQTQNSSVFAQNPASRSSVFDRLGPQQSFGQQNQAKSIFAQANQSIFSQVQPNVFQSQNQVAAKSLFAQASQRNFGQSQSNINQPPVAASVFASANRTIPRDPFNQQSSPFGSSGSVFQISDRPPSNPFGMMVEQTTSVDDSVYSKMEDLSQADIDAFESTDFKLGFIPELPPPRTLCV